jgi:hypothetical protein
MLCLNVMSLPLAVQQAQLHSMLARLLLPCLQVVGGGTLEVTLSQFWSSLGSSSLQLEMSFHGLLLLGPSGEEAGGGDGLTLEGAAGPTKVGREGTRGSQARRPTVAVRHVVCVCCKPDRSVAKQCRWRPWVPLLPACSGSRQQARHNWHE